MLKKNHYLWIGSAARLEVAMALVSVILTEPLSAAKIGESGMKNDKSKIQANDSPWQNNDPLQFLDILKRNSKSVVQVSGKAPSDWINQKHADKLLHLLGSNDPASPVLEIKCPTLPKAPSTVGKQASYLLLGYIEDQFPPSGNSDIQSYSDDQIRRLASLRHQSESADKDAIAIGFAQQELQRGESLQAKRDYKEAVKAYSFGIARLGDRYTSPNLIDDTGVKQTLAKSEQAKGNFETASNLLHNLLESRIQSYQKKTLLKRLSRRHPNNAAKRSHFISLLATKCSPWLTSKGCNVRSKIFFKRCRAKNSFKSGRRRSTTRPRQTNEKKGLQ